MDEKNYTYYQDNGCCYIKQFLERNPEFDNDDFVNFVIGKNKADRDYGELQDIAKHEILRLAFEWVERKWRFPNCHKREEEWNK